MLIFSEIFKNIDSVNVPNVIKKISTKRLLTMNFLEGNKLLSFTKHNATDRKKLAINMFKAWYLPFYRYGVIHGDPIPIAALSMKTNSLGGFTPPIFFSSLCTFDAASAP